MSSLRFHYLTHWISLCCACAYLLYRFYFGHTFVGQIPFFRDHFNDILCMPIFLPPVLWIDRQVGLRHHDLPPTPFEIFFHWIIWSAYFEGFAPLFPGIYRTTADPYDVLAYLLGALIASLFWRSWQFGPRVNLCRRSLLDDVAPQSPVVTL